MTSSRHALGLTAYGCTRHEAALFRVMAPRYGVLPTLSDLDLSERTVGLALANRCVSVSHKTPVTNADLRALAGAGVDLLVSRSIGLDHIDVEYAAGQGIAVAGSGYSPDGVADYTLMLILMALRHARSTFSRSAVHDYRMNDSRGRELRDLTVGVVGTGRIGSAVIERLRGFGCQVLAHDVSPRRSAVHVPLDDLLDRSDVVTLHVPLDVHTHHLLDRRRIRRMKRGAVVVNTGRGALLDTAALVDALELGHLGGAALDVVEGETGVFYADRRSSAIHNEPLLRLQALPNVLVSPHTAFDTDHAAADMVESTLIRCLEHATQESAWTG